MSVKDPVEVEILLASVGPSTSAVESVATSIGAGLLLGAFIAGALGTLRSWSADDRDRAAVDASYIGGLVAVAAAASDLMR